MKMQIKLIKDSNPTTRIAYVDDKDSGYRIVKKTYGKPYRVELNNKEVYQCSKLFTAKAYIYSVLNNLPIVFIITFEN